ncbi:hypothetical protein CLOHYLEM_06993 [[Clostridium] hylemonae DSM 15053]|uniref:Uncharacterized protein n=1 Tax=[Clostridium] hylemonae DSM 15053 TaxID=553973 RepID=C0C4H7_9FIRM|nr:hypothetical protein CLOHYLEM_06993 [[Clostridium] hylemonae DSM 15053]
MIIAKLHDPGDQMHHCLKNMDRQCIIFLDDRKGVGLIRRT